MAGKNSAVARSVWFDPVRFVGQVILSVSSFGHLTPSKGVELSHHFPTPSEGVIGPYSVLFLPTECSERFPLRPHLFTPSEGVVFSRHFPTPSKGVKQASYLQNLATQLRACCSPDDKASIAGCSIQSVIPLLPIIK